jgi:hypothetical protein
VVERSETRARRSSRTFVDATVMPAKGQFRPKGSAAN